jgi:hypothetical protein
MGSFSDLGWSWNVKPPASMVGSRRASTPSAEFIESLLIFIYGSTNVFLEHLGTTDGVWTVGDLEHVSITVMFFGGGLVCVSQVCYVFLFLEKLTITVWNACRI